jgi:predicted component of type VI protein secretion system
MNHKHSKIDMLFQREQRSRGSVVHTDDGNVYKPENEPGARKRYQFDTISSAQQSRLRAETDLFGVNTRYRGVLVPDVKKEGSVYRLNDSLSATSSIISLKCTEAQLCSILALIPHISSYELLSSTAGEYKALEPALEYLRTHEDACPTGSILYKTSTREIVYELLQLSLAVTPITERLSTWKKKFCCAGDAPSEFINNVNSALNMIAPSVSNNSSSDVPINLRAIPKINLNTVKKSASSAAVTGFSSADTGTFMPFCSLSTSSSASLFGNLIEDDSVVVLAAKCSRGSTVFDRQDMYWTFVLQFPHGFSSVSFGDLQAILYNSFHDYQLLLVIPQASKTLSRLTEFCGLLQYSFFTNINSCIDFVSKQYAAHHIVIDVPDRDGSVYDMSANSPLPPIEVTGNEADTLALSELLHLPIVSESKERAMRWLSQDLNVKRKIIDGQLHFIGVKYTTSGELKNQDASSFDYNPTSGYASAMHMEEAMPSNDFDTTAMVGGGSGSSSALDNLLSRIPIATPAPSFSIITSGDLN